MYAIRLLGIVLVLAVAGLSRPAFAAESVEYAPEAVRADFDALYATLKAAHYDLFARRNQKDYDARYLSMRAGFDKPMTHLEVVKAFQRFVAYGSVAHAQIPLPFAEFQAFIDDGGRMLPLSVRVVDGGVFITDDASGLHELNAGAELVTVNGTPALQWLAMLERYISADHPPLAHGLTEFWLEMLVWLEFGERDALTVAVRDAAGRVQTIDVPFRTIDAIRAERKRQATPGLAVDFNTREVRLLEDGVAYLRPGPFYNTSGEKTWDDAEFRAFIDTAFGKMLAANVTDLIIDLRNNPGGDKSFSDLMVAWFADRPFQFYSTFKFKVSELTRKAILERAETYKDLPASLGSAMQEMVTLVNAHENGDLVALAIDDASPREGARFEGRVYALINRHSYSNATAVAALLQDAEGRDRTRYAAAVSR